MRIPTSSRRLATSVHVSRAQHAPLRINHATKTYRCCGSAAHTKGVDFFARPSNRSFTLLPETIIKSHRSKSEEQKHATWSNLVSALPSRCLSLREFSSATSSPSMAQLVKDLRSATGAPMMDCKRALQAEGVGMDLTKAAEYLRSHGGAKISSKIAGRETSEGMVGLLISKDVGAGATDDKTPQRAVLVKIASETDFASRSEAFANLISSVARAAINVDLASCPVALEHQEQKGGSVRSIDLDEVLLDATIPDTSFGGGRVKDVLEEAVLSIRENLKLQSAMVLTSGDGSESSESILVGYIHKRSPHSDFAGSAASVVELRPMASVGDDGATTDDMEAIGKKLAMHVVAARPTYLSRDHVPVDVVEKEKNILAEQVASSGKKQSPNIVEKIISGRLNKFYEEVCLEDQHHVAEEGNVKVSQVLKDAGIRVNSFQIASI